MERCVGFGVHPGGFGGDHQTVPAPAQVGRKLVPEKGCRSAPTGFRELHYLRDCAIVISVYGCQKRNHFGCRLRNHYRPIFTDCSLMPN